jgi:hypothetical protein
VPVVPAAERREVCAETFNDVLSWMFLSSNHDSSDPPYNSGYMSSLSEVVRTSPEHGP